MSFKAMAKEKGKLRKAGQRLRIGAKRAMKTAKSMDDAYAEKIIDMYLGTKENPKQFTDNPALGSVAGLAAI